MLLKLLGGTAALAIVAPHAAAASLQEDARAFGSRESVRDLAMSPDGSKIAMLVSGPGSETILRVADVNSGAMVNLTKSDRPQSLRWCSFAGNSQLVCEHSGIETFDGKPTGFGGLITISVDGSSMKPLRQRSQFTGGRVRQFDGSVIDWLPGSEGAVLMARNYAGDVNTTGSILGRSRGGLGVDRIDLRTLKSSQVEAPRDTAASYMSDGRGNVRVLVSAVDDHAGLMTGRLRVSYRTAKSRDWRELGSYDIASGEGWYPLAVDADANALFALRKVNGRDALYSVKLDGSAAATAIGANPSVDIDGIVRLGPGQRIIGYTFADDRRRTVYFDAEYAKLQAGLAKALPNQPQISFQGATADGTKIVILASGDTHPGTFYRYDKQTKQLASIAPVRANLEGRQLAPVKPITVAAGDGVSIPAYLTLPPGTTGKGLPAVVLPHGGPSARDEWGFDWLPQFLAARGYAVIQPNFRGSAGYGEDWLGENAFRNWRVAISDVSAAARYLQSTGIADPNRIAIVGWSYGGYAALQSAATEPSLYKAAVAIAPVTDLDLLKREAQGFTNAKLVEEQIGSGDHVATGSPARRAASIRAPVLMFHGDMDANVGFAHSEQMEDALRSAKIPVEFVRFKGLDHQLDDSNARVQMLTRIGEFLDKAIGH